MPSSKLEPHSEHPAPTLPSPPGGPADILRRAQGGQSIIQDFCPLADSIEWELGQKYFQSRGNRAFVSDVVPVPFAINNDGNFSSHAAEVLFTSLLHDPHTFHDEMYVLELGVGMGLFARFFLDHFRDLCIQRGADFYDRLCYIAGDYSERMLLDLARSGVLSSHVGHYRLRVVDAMRPVESLELEIGTGKQRSGLRAVFLNYLLDCLPAAVLDFSDAQLKQLCVRTCLARGVKLDEYSDLKPEDLAARVSSRDATAREELLDLSDLFVAEYDFRPTETRELAYGDFIHEFGTRQRGCIVHSYGAIQSLESLLPLLHDRGIILINDYGSTEVEQAVPGFEHQRYAGATFVGLNFGLLREYFGTSQKCGWFEPVEDKPNIHSRLLGRAVAGNVVQHFQDLFSKANFEGIRAPHGVARGLVNAQRFESAVTAYREALLRQPYNWMLVDEVARLLAYNLGEFSAGLEMARAALRLNPACSSRLWDTAGNCLFCLSRVDEARKAFLRAIRINPNDVRARFNVARIYAFDKQYEASLQAISEGLAIDRDGTYRQAFLNKQAEVLTQLVQRQAQATRRLCNRVRRLEDPSVVDAYTEATRGDHYGEQLSLSPTDGPESARRGAMDERGASFQDPGSE
jgi:tetratricopeptide (TPR) repeat protein